MRNVEGSTASAIRQPQLSRHGPAQPLGG